MTSSLRSNSDSHPRLQTFAMVAGEASGDTLGADLIKSLQKRYPNAQFVGIGGPKMIQQGFKSWFPMEALSVMGFFEVLRHLPKLLRLRKTLIKKLLALQPDVFIGIDAPDFNFKVEGILKAHQITSIHYVGPSVWAWREKRLIKIKRDVNGVLVLFPFETPLYQRYSIPVKFVGHPLANEFPEMPNTNAAREQLGLATNSSITAILPGSRMSEIKQMILPYVQSAQSLAQTYASMQFVIPCVHEQAYEWIHQTIEKHAPNASFILIKGQSRLVLEACDQALVTSGTATLECALMKKPFVLAMKVHPLSYWIMRRLATTQWIGLPNILAQQSIVTELIQNDASVANIVHAMQNIIKSEAQRMEQIAVFQTQYNQLRQNASQRAADAIETWMC